MRQILVPELKKPDIVVKVEYSAENLECEVNVSYSSEKFDINDTENELSLTMLKNTAEEFNYSFDDETGMSLVNIRIRSS